MSTVGDKACPYHFDRHAPDYIDHFAEITRDMHEKCPLAWSDTYGGHWVASGYKEVFEIARNATLLSNDHDVEGVRKGYQGIAIPGREGYKVRGGFLEMDPPEQKDYRRAIDPYLSPAAIARWKPMTDDITRASLDECIETGRIDFVDDLANIVPAVMTMAMLGLPLDDWVIYCEPAHATVYTPPDSPDMARVIEISIAMGMRMVESITDIRRNPRPGIVNALIEASICGRPASDDDIRDSLMLLIGGGFDTTTALTAHSLEWLSEHPAERDRLVADLTGLLDPATEEFLRFYTPAPGDGRTVTHDHEVSGRQLEEGDRLWLSWAMANRDPSIFADPDSVKIDRRHNRHTSFGLGVHRCIGSNVARTVFKSMLTAVLQRMPDFVCEPAGAVHYDTIGVINGMKHLPARFTPGPRLGAGLQDTIALWQQRIDDEGLAAPVTRVGAPAS
ncbi:MAG TPA: cytochrome P450 [Acidimicrobiales bacterium]|nr:cytochrome P450 [Acidimicrobiales bacterium]